MSANSRAAKRQKQSHPHPLPSDSPSTPSRARKPQTPLRKKQSTNALSNRRSRNNQTEDEDGDEPAIESHSSGPRRSGRQRTSSSKVLAAQSLVEQKTPSKSKGRREIGSSAHAAITSRPRKTSSISTFNGVDVEEKATAVRDDTPVEDVNDAEDDSRTHDVQPTSSEDSEDAVFKHARAKPNIFGDSEVNASQTNWESEATFYAPHLETIKKVVIERLSGKRKLLLYGLDEERKKVHTLLEQTIAAGEGNSLLIIGARGTGKSTMVNGVLDELSQKNKDQFHIIRLNGFIHTDDKIALREIWRQLGREMDLDEEGHMRNDADTLATLLAVLSHPAELSGDASLDQAAKSVVFVLDEFDLFASHPRQTLLYNLFDVAQSRKAPIAVLGLTTRVDIAESLEKRVKSRFSHRYVHLSLPDSLDTLTEICRSALQIGLHDLTPAEYDSCNSVTCPTQSAPCEKRPRSNVKPTARRGPVKRPPHFVQQWNDTVAALLETRRVTAHLARIHHTTRSVPAALTSFVLPVSLIAQQPPSETLLFPLALLAATAPPDSKLALLPSLPPLALALLVAAARLDVILDADVCSFAMAYDEYAALVGRARAAGAGAPAAGPAARVAGRAAARALWEALVQLELVIPEAGRAAAGSGAAVVADTDMVRCDVALEEIEGAVPGLDAAVARWCREI